MDKRKVDSENKAFQNQWEAEYMFTDIAGKPVCLICGANVAVIKEYNLRWYYETKHQDKLKNLNAEQKLQKVEELKRNLTSLFTKVKSQSEAAVKESFIVAEEIAKSARPFTKGEFLKSCMMKVCHILCSDKKQVFANVSLSRNMVADWVCEMTTDLETQLIERGKDFVAYSLAVDESTDTTDPAQLAIFIRGVDSILCITEEILDIKSMHGTTTGKDIFENVFQSVTDMKLPWDKLVGLTTHGAPAMCGEKSGLVGRMQLKMQKENCTYELTAYHCIIHQETLCGKVLNGTCNEHCNANVYFIVLKYKQQTRYIQFKYEAAADNKPVLWVAKGRKKSRKFRSVVQCPTVLDCMSS